jgi:hypothetical protein
VCLQGHVYRSKTYQLERWHNRPWNTDEHHMPSGPADLTKIHVRSLTANIVQAIGNILR